MVGGMWVFHVHTSQNAFVMVCLRAYPHASSKCRLPVAMLFEANVQGGQVKVEKAWENTVEIDEGH